jgi:hypothetical protein
MRTRSIAAAATAGALALGGAAIAMADVGPFGDGPEVSEAEFAGDLAGKLDGVSAAEVRRALRELREEHHAERRREMAAGLAEQLDVSRADAEAALEKAEARGPRDFIGTLARELDKTRREVRNALAAMAREHFDAMLDRAVKEGHLTEEQADRARERFREGPPGFHRHGFVGPGGPPGFGPGGPPGFGPGGPPRFGPGGPPGFGLERHHRGRPGGPRDSIPVPPPMMLPPPR